MADLWTQITDVLCNQVTGVGEHRLIEQQRIVWDGSTKAWALLPSSSIHGDGLVLVSIGKEGERRGLEVIRAFFGPVLIAKFSPRKITLASGPEIFIQTAIISPGEWQQTISVLTNMVDVRIGTRPIERIVAQPLSTLLRDYYIALASGSDAEAESIVEKIKETGLLRGDNLEFLWVHRLATFGKWNEIFESEKFDDLCRTRRSRLISEELLTAIWYRDFRDLETTVEPSALQSRFAEANLSRRYRDLLGSLETSELPQVRILLSLFLGSLGDAYRISLLIKDLPKSEADRLTAISGLQVPDSGSDRDVIGELKVQSGHPCSILLIEGDHQGVLAYFEKHPEDVKALGFAIESVAELGDSESAIRLVKCVDLGLCPIPNTKLLRDALEVMRQKAEGHCAGWLEWAFRSATTTWGESFHVVSNYSHTWDVSWCDNSDLADAFSNDFIVGFNGPNASLVQQSLAFILELVGDNAQRGAISHVRSAALGALVNLEMSNAQIRNAFVSLISSYEDGNISVSDYVEILDASMLVWDSYAAASTFPWILDVIEQISQLPRLDDGKFHQLLNEVFVASRAFDQNIDSFLHDLLCDLATPFFAIERRSRVDGSSDQNVWSKFSGLKVGIYSLLESLPDLRLKLQALCPDANFVINQEKVASQELRTFASSCDIVVIQSSKAKHAATEELNRFILGDRIYVAGRGRGSIINSLLNWNPRL